MDLTLRFLGLGTVVGCLRLRVAIVKQGGRMVVYWKGASEIVLGQCTHFFEEGKMQAMDAEVRQELDLVIQQMANSALRTSFPHNTQPRLMVVAPTQTLGFCPGPPSRRPAVCVVRVHSIFMSTSGRTSSMTTAVMTLELRCRVATHIHRISSYNTAPRMHI